MNAEFAHNEFVSNMLAEKDKYNTDKIANESEQRDSSNENYQVSIQKRINEEEPLIANKKLLKKIVRKRKNNTTTNNTNNSKKGKKKQ